MEEHINYQRIEKAIRFIRGEFKRQPSLEEIAAHVHLSPAHFQRMFTDWAGTSPKKFLQYISLEYAKQLLRDERQTLFDATLETGLSATSRLHDLFVTIEGMTPADYKNGAGGLTISYNFAETPFGNVIIAATDKGICRLAFHADKDEALTILKQQFPNAKLLHGQSSYHQQALQIFSGEPQIETIRLHLKGSPFQLKVWEALLKIPSGNLSTYGKLASGIGSPNASRAVGTAIGSNPVAFLIPCHRVIQSSGNTGGYMWGEHRKTAIIGWEAAQLNALP